MIKIIKFYISKFYLFYIVFFYIAFVGNVLANKLTLITDNRNISVFNYSSLLKKSAITNPIIFNAAAVSPGKIVLTWEKLSDSLFTKIIIWKGLKDGPMEKLFSENEFSAIKIPVSDTTYSVTGLSANTTYFFGLQALTKDGLWVSVSKDSLISVKTPTSSSDTIPNVIKLNIPIFDTVSNVIKISWCIDTSNKIPLDSLQIGITYSLDSVFNLNEMQTLQVDKNCDSTILKTNSILFNTNYHIGMWLSKLESGIWSKPTSLSTKDIVTDSFTHQTVTFFENGKDTVTAANGSIRLWTETRIVPPTTDTLKIHKIQVRYPGFIIVNNGFSFTKKENTPAFNIGLQYSNLPSRYKSSQIRMYREINGVPNIIYEAENDTLNKIMFTKTDNIQYPFMLMIDTARPEIKITTDTSLIIKLGSDINDTFYIKDSVGNVKWYYQYGRGEGDFTGSDSGYFSKSDKNKIATILQSYNIINEDNGVRIRLIVTDGTFTDTINCSRRVARQNSDQSILPAKQWFPLFATAKLNYPQPESLLTKLKESDSLYDVRYARMFRWCPPKSDTSVNEGWVEYSAASCSLFTFTPGKIIWVKTLHAKNVGLGAGKTLSLRENYVIKLPPLSWSDIGLPFHFNMNLIDILKSTKNSDTLHFFKWIKGPDSTFSTDPLYIPGFSNQEWLSQDTEIVYENSGGLAIYNNSNDTVSLNFPPIPYIVKSLKKKAPPLNDNSWSVTINCKNSKDKSISKIYYGYKSGVTDKYYPVSPSFDDCQVVIYDRKSNKKNGIFITGDISKGGFSKEVAFINNSDVVSTFYFSSLQNGNLPPDFKTVFFNPVAKEFETNGSVTVNAHSTEYRWAVTSNDAYLTNNFSKTLSFDYSLGLPYPNPCRSLLMIPFTIPFGSKDKIRIEIFDQLGRLIWKRKINELLEAGKHKLIWNGKNQYNSPISAGFYIVRFTSESQQGKITSRFHNRFTFLP